MLVTFGGAFSNHIVATAFAARQAGLKSLGIIRGEQAPVLSQTLREAAGYGMELTFISRKDYEENRYAAINPGLQNYHIIPEGGASAAGVKGASEIMNLVKKDIYSHIACAIGTGTMFRGLLQASLPRQQVMGIPVLKGFENWPAGDEMAAEKATGRIYVPAHYHGGGYAKASPELFKFMNGLFEQAGIPTDFVYTGKLLYAVFDLIGKDYFARGSRVLVIHSGGLQGNQSLAPQTLDF
jgi:1-aminocyclopropane-1-carboxylate deaminase